MRIRLAALLALVAAFACGDPVEPDGEITPGQFVAIGAGSYHACAIDTIGRAWCWGSNEYGQAGAHPNCKDCIATPRLIATEIRFTAITAGSRHSCGLATDGLAWCWGDNEFRQLGAIAGEVCPSDTPCSSTPVAVGGGHHFKSLVGGSYGTCGITDAGVAKCWGFQAFSPSFSKPLPETVRLSPTGDSLWNAIGHTDGGLSGCGVTASNIAACWGLNSFGQRGLGAISGGYGPPVATLLSEPVKYVSSGSNFSCALTIAGDAYCWGLAQSGSLGLGASATSDLCSSGTPYTCHATPQKVVGARHYSSMTVGLGHVCAIEANSGETFCWGSNFLGAIGAPSYLGIDQIAPSPLPSANVMKFSAISAGYQFTCGLTSDRNVYCWGSNLEGELGLPGGTIYAAFPIRIVASTP